MTSPRCSEESRHRVGGIAREQVEHAVRRAEASIAPPAPVGTLACLESLMSLPLGSFAASDAWTVLFGDTLDPLTDASGTLVRRFCAVAEREWQKVTAPLATSLHGAGTLPSRFFKSVMTRSAREPLHRPGTDDQKPAGPAESDAVPEAARGLRAIWQSFTGE